jgi:hypothetical protein
MEGNTMHIKPTVENYALHLKTTRSDRELHDLIGSLSADEDVMDAWDLTEDDYFTAIEIAYFAPEEITHTIQ